MSTVPEAEAEGAAVAAGRILVAGVGNVLRGDDGFGPAVIEALAELPDCVDVIETGIGGIALLQELMDGYDSLILVDAVERGAEPGTVFLIEPEVLPGKHVPDIHLANPHRVLGMAKAMGVLPGRVVIIGCQPLDVEEMCQGLSPPVQQAVPSAARRIAELVDAWL